VISSVVRAEPTHQPDASSCRQTPVQGLMVKLLFMLRVPFVEVTEVLPQLLCCRRNSQTKNSPPNSPVTKPIGTSSGAMTVRAALPDHSKSTAPSIALAGRTRAQSPPTTMRTICGTIRPTNPIMA